MDVHEKVTNLIKKYKTGNPFKLAEYKNINIIYANLGGIYGNYVQYRRAKFIIIDNERTPEELMNFVCAHELGHALFTPNDNTQWLKTYTMKTNADKIEYIANQFAVELLLNDECISEHMDKSIYSLADHKGVPHEFIPLKGALL